MRCLLALISVLFAAPPCLADSQTIFTEEPGSTVVVSQGGVQLSMADIDEYAAEIPDDTRAQVFHSPKHIESILRGLLLTKQLANEALSTQTELSPETHARYSRSQYQALSKARIEELRTQFQSKVPDMHELAQERYLSNPKAFATPRQVDVEHILIGTNADRDDAEAKALAEKLYTSLQEDPSQFEALVETYSDDKSKKDNHGLIEDANSERTVKAFSQAADSLTRIDQIIGPVKTTYGYHILKAIRISPASEPSFVEVEPALLEKLKKNWVAARVQAHIDALRSQKIDANPTAIASLRTRYLHVDKKVEQAGSDKPAAKTKTTAKHAN